MVHLCSSEEKLRHGATETQILSLCVGQCHRCPFLTQTAQALISTCPLGPQSSLRHTSAPGKTRALFLES